MIGHGWQLKKKIKRHQWKLINYCCSYHLENTWYLHITILCFNQDTFSAKIADDKIWTPLSAHLLALASVIFSTDVETWLKCHEHKRLLNMLRSITDNPFYPSGLFLVILNHLMNGSLNSKASHGPCGHPGYQKKWWNVGLGPECVQEAAVVILTVIWYIRT